MVRRLRVNYLFIIPVMFALSSSANLLTSTGLVTSAAYAENTDSAHHIEATTTSNNVLDSFRAAVHKVVLSNGLRVIFVQRNIAPVFVGQTWVKVGGVNEVPGKTGASHMLEHMAFKGTASVGTKNFVKEKPLLDRLEVLITEITKANNDTQNKNELPKLQTELQSVQANLQDFWVNNEFSAIYERAGSSGMNAGTSKDFTMYTVSLPVSAFELWCSMESDRILHPVFRQFYKEREVVMEERRMRVEDNPGGMLYEHLLAASYLSHPNRLPVIGWYSDIKNLRTADVMDLHNTYYRPDNMVLSIVGDLNLAEIQPMLEKYFGRIPKRSSPLPTVTTTEGQQRGSRHVNVEHDAQPQLILAYHKPTYPDPDDGYFAVVHSLLSEGRSSLLYKELVQRDKIASEIGTSEGPGTLFPSLFLVAASPTKGVKLEVLQDRIQEILEQLKTRTISSELLAQAKQRALIGFISGIASSSGMAGVIGESELLWNDWSAIIKSYETIQKTTNADVKRLSEKYLNVSNRTSAFLTNTLVGNYKKTKN